MFLKEVSFAHRGWIYLKEINTFIQQGHNKWIKSDIYNVIKYFSNTLLKAFIYNAL